MPNRRTPNILLIILDCVRADHVSSYGYKWGTTPNLDSIASEGVLFEKAISPSSWSLPTHTSLFTGLFPSEHNVVHRFDGLPPGTPTLASRLRQLGYETVCVTANSYVNRGSGLAEGFDGLIETWKKQPDKAPSGRRTWRRRVKSALRSVGLGGYADRWSLLPRYRGQRTVSSALLNHTRLKEWLDTKWDPDKPFFAFINDMDCHQPYAPPAHQIRRFMPKGVSAWRLTSVNQDWEKLAVGAVRMTEEDLTLQRALYDAALAHLDEQIGDLVDHLRSMGILDNTVIVLTADHGEGLGDHMDLEHGISLYNSLIHVPLIMRGGDDFRGGGRVSDIVQLHDLHSTLLGLAGGSGLDSPMEASLDLRGGSGRTEAYAQLAARSRKWANVRDRFPDFDTRPHDVEMQAVVTENHKLIWKSDGCHEFYDIRKDPGELLNLYPEGGPELNDCASRLSAFRATTATPRIEGRRAVYEDEVVERLRALGYVD